MKVFLIVIIISMLVIQTGCKTNSRAKLSTQKKRKQEAMQAVVDKMQAFTIRIAEGGGFTGLTKGYSLYSNGKVEHWQRFPVSSDSIIWKAEVEPVEIKEFQQKLESTGMLQKSIKQTGNITTSITYQLPDTTYSWHWAGSGSVGNIPQEFREWYQSVKKFCVSIKK